MLIVVSLHIQRRNIELSNVYEVLKIVLVFLRIHTNTFHFEPPLNISYTS